MSTSKNHSEWNILFQGSANMDTEAESLPGNQELAGKIFDAITGRLDYFMLPGYCAKTFSELDPEETADWLEFASAVPIKLSSLGLSVRKCGEIFRTCIITDEEIDKLARSDHRNYVERKHNSGWLYSEERDYSARTDPCLQLYENLPGRMRDFFREMNYLIPVILKKSGYEVYRPGECTGIDEKMITRLAKAIHAMYISEIRRMQEVSKGAELLPDWEDLSEDARASNIDNARHIPTKLLAIGYRIEPGKEGYRAATLVLNEEEVETMARIEHLRWCCDKRVKGWTSGSATHEDRKVHASLIPYSKLSESDKRKDRELVRLIPALLQDLNYETIPVGLDRISSLSYAINPESTVHRVLRMTRKLEEEIQKLDILSEPVKSKLEEIGSTIEIALDEVRSSYVYARHIQETFLPEDLMVHEIFPESFILYKPKDIVSGDFYYFSRHGSVTIFAAADCTGHGIPGALLSTIGYGFIDQAVNELGITRPALVLHHLYSRIHRFLRRYEDGTYISDDMDIALCTYDHDSRLLRFSGVGIPLYRITPLSTEPEVYKTRNYPAQLVGNSGEIKGKGFEELEITLEYGDILYLGSDGLADQFGGEEKKKFGRRRLINLLKEISALPMPRQKEKMELTIEDWKEAAKESQTDDILMLGIHI